MAAKRAEPTTLSRSLVKAMDHERLALVETTWVPDRYAVQINSQDWSLLRPILGEVRQQLVEVLEQRIRDRDYRLLTERIELELDEGATPPGEPFMIHSSFTRAGAAAPQPKPRPAHTPTPPPRPAVHRASPTPSQPIVTAELSPRKPATPRQPSREDAPLPSAGHAPHRPGPPADDMPLVTGEIFPSGYSPQPEPDPIAEKKGHQSSDRLPLVDSGYHAKPPAPKPETDTDQQPFDPFVTGPIDMPHDLNAVDVSDDFKFDTLGPDEPPSEQLRMPESPPSVDNPPTGGGPAEDGHRETMMISRLHDAPTMHMSSDELQQLMGEESARGGAYFQEYVDNKPGRKLPLAGVELVIGRGEVDILSPITDGLISRRHAVLSTDPRGRWRIKDISVNGIKVNGRPVKETLLKNDDTIEIGRWKLEFHNPSTESDA